MSHFHLASALAAASVADARSIGCLKCSAPFAFRRSAVPCIDACGFESYRFACRECGAALAGIIDPADETLLLSEATA